MSDDDLVRWSEAEDAPPGMQDLIRRARPPQKKMPASVRAAILAQLADAPGGPGNDPKPRLGTPRTMPSAGVVAGAAGLGAAIVAAIVLSLPSRPPDVSVDAGTALPAVSSEPSPPSAVVPPPLPASASAPSSAVPSARGLATPPSIASARASTKPASDVDTLAEESALVGRARATIASNPATSLVALDEHARRFPRGAPAPERDALRV